MVMRNIAYKEYKRKSDIHGTVLYPAVMVAPMQKEILSELIDKNKKVNVFDPFHGSGTSLYEAMEISKNLNLVGCDINPLANLISLVKLQGVTNNVLNDLKKLKERLEEPATSEHIHSFPNVKKWFRDDIILSLSHVRQSIMKISDKQNRLFFWYMFCDIIRKYSNSRSSTYKLHIKKEEDITKINNNVIIDYMDSVEQNWSKFTKNFHDFVLHKKDVLSFLKEVNNNEFDICITSPPYGDNNTTVPYGQFSMLPLYWIDSKDLNLEGWELNNFSIIDSKSMGGGFSQGREGKIENDLLKPFIEGISIKKKRKVLRFFSDYFLLLDEISRVTSSHIIMTLGNRTVDGININLTEITIRYLSEKGFIPKEVLEREIISKRIPKKVSRVNSKPVSSMNEEYLIVMYKSSNKL